MPDVPVVTTLVPPLALIRQQHSTRLDHALFLTFTLDLQYFERVALGALRAAGARVTVVADAFASHQDPRAVRWAGRTYLAGQAAGALAFHPKLVLLLGPDHAISAIGSGNLTPSGWQRNAELWTVLRTTATSAPSALGELVGWLQEIPDAIALGPGVAESLFDAADHLSRILATRRTVAVDTRILHNLHDPIIDQFPTGPSQHLGVSSPFHDPEATTLQALWAKLRPTETTVVIQTSKTRLDAAATRTELSRVHGKVLKDAQPDPYRHGKLIEWVDLTDQRWALTGSPNLTSAALRHNIASGQANCELSILTPINDSLLPTGEPVDLDQCPTLPPTKGHNPSGPHLLGALLNPDHVVISLAAALPTAGQIQVWPADDIEERWLPATTIPGGVQKHIRLPDLDEQFRVPGSRYRLASPKDDTQALSNVVFLTGPAALHPPAPTASSADIGWDDLVHDPAALERLLDLLQEAEDHLTPATNAPYQQHRGHTAVSWSGQMEYWEAVAGTTLVRAVASTSADSYDAANVDPKADHTTQEGIVNLDDLVSDRPLEEDPDADRPDVEQPTDPDNEEQEEPEPSAAEPPDTPEQAARRRDALQRRIYQRGAQWAAVVATQPLIVRLIGLRFALHGLGYARTAPATEACTRFDWHELLVRFTAAVGEGNVPSDAEPAAGSLVAVALAVLDDLCRDAKDDEQALEATRGLTAAREAAAYLTLAADRGLLTHHARELHDQYGYAVDLDRVLELVDRLTAPDPYRDAATHMNDLDLTVEVSGRLLVIHTDTSRPARRLALEAIGHIPLPDPAAALVTTPRGRCLAIHNIDRLLLVEQETNHLALWRLYLLSGPTAPTRHLLAGRTNDLSRWEERRPGPLTTPPATAEDLLLTIGITTPLWTGS